MKTLLSLVLAAALVAAVILFARTRTRTDVVTAAAGPVTAVTYRCDGGRTIDASLFPAGETPPVAAGSPPAPEDSARIELSDGRTLMLHRTISADGVRYSDADPSVEGGEAFVFWSRGNGAFVLERDTARTYTGCVRIAPDPGGLPQVFSSGAIGFSIRYPAGYSVDSTYRYQALGPGRDIEGVSFTVQAGLAEGTNLSADSHVSVEALPAAGGCAADRFLSQGAGVSDTTIAGGTLSVAHRAEAAVGNRYEETVFAYPGTGRCRALRYFVHWTVLENYPPGAVTAFDRKALLDRFDAMRTTLVLAH